jgi:parvulin-like peptidyl-prolyl isomerase
MRNIRLVLFLSCALGVAGCERSVTPGAPGGSASVASAGSGQAEVLATVNGARITKLDLEQRMRQSGGHSSKAPPVSTAGVLDTVIRDELVRQRAVELGLDQDASYQKKLEEIQAQLAAMERRELADLFFQKEVVEKVKVSDDDARKYFEQNAAKVKTELHVFQLLYNRDEAAANAALAEIRGGASFESVAAKRFPGLQEIARKPWDLGFLRWNQMPEQWWGVVFDMEPAKVSEIIRGEDGRFWILKVVERREITDLKFEDVKPRIMAVLQRERTEARRAELFKELRDKAKIDYAAGSAPPAGSR